MNKAQTGRKRPTSRDDRIEMIAQRGESTDVAIEIEQEDIIALVFFLNENSGEAEAERR